MKIDDLKNIVLTNLKDKTKEVKRVFHGRGNFYENYNYLTIDSLDNLLLICLFEEIQDCEYKDIKNLIDEVLSSYNFEIVLIQHRYKKDEIFEIIKGELPTDFEACENGLKYSLNFSNQNIGLFFDMKKGREYIKSISKDKNVLNLFSYTCAFSVASLSGKAKQVVNVDMAKGALSTGRVNHHLNNLDTKKVKFMPYNILKSWSRIKKEAPYDIIIIDPPSFQKGSFAATKDYEKIIKRLDELSNENCIVLSCLNAPELDTNFIEDLFKQNAPMFKFEKRLENLDTYPCIDEEKSLKNMIFKRV